MAGYMGVSSPVLGGHTHTGEAHATRDSIFNGQYLHHRTLGQR